MESTGGERKGNPPAAGRPVDPAVSPNERGITHMGGDCLQAP